VAIRYCTMQVRGSSAYSASRNHEEPKLPKERPDEYDARTWRSKIRVEGGQVVIDPMAFKFGLDKAASMLGRKIPGRASATFTKFFASGVIVAQPVAVAPESAIECERLFVHANGKRGSGSRVWRHFPRVQEWGGAVPFEVIADEISRDVFEEFARYAGLAVGVGRFRPENGGYLGRYVVESFKWQES
jgi:hypothetical protein